MLEPWAMLYLIIAICYVLYLIIQFYLKHENKKQKQQKLNKNPIQHRNTSIAKRLESINKSINILEEKILKSGRKPKKSNQKIGENLPMKPTGDGTGTVGSGGMAGELQGLRENAYITTEQILENSAHGTVYGSLSTQDQVIKQEPLGKPTRPYKRQTIPNLNSSRHVPYKNLKNNTSSSETSSTSRDSSPGNVQNFTETQTHQPNKEILTGLDYLRQGGLRNRKKVIPKHEKDIKFERMDKLRKAKRMREELEKIEAQERLIEEKLNLQNGGGWSKMDELKNKIYKGGVNSGNYTKMTNENTDTNSTHSSKNTISTSINPNSSSKSNLSASSFSLTSLNSNQSAASVNFKHSTCSTSLTSSNEQKNLHELRRIMEEVDGIRQVV